MEQEQVHVQCSATAARNLHAACTVQVAHDVTQRDVAHGTAPKSAALRAHNTCPASAPEEHYHQ